MPVDQKRINGPEGSFSYNIYRKENELTFDEKRENLFKKDGTRSDGRRLDESRKFCKFCPV
jgi:exosome complex component MTR3